MLELMLNPATIELIWTLSVTTLLMVAGGLTILIMPWKDDEIMAVHRTVSSVAAAHLPVPLATATMPSNQAAHTRRSLAST
ncbi:MAG: hypothetical protein P8R54_07870 [Myxococcota bacterium]|nr:hypothetical protein [Myxococcota bacterium]